MTFTQKTLAQAQDDLANALAKLDTIAGQSSGLEFRLAESCKTPDPICAGKGFGFTSFRAGGNLRMCRRFALRVLQSAG